MKKILYMVVPIAIALSGCTPLVYTTNQQATYTDASPTDQVFYDELSPYGNWIDYPDYGYVWSPAVDYDFRPYVTNGYWVYSDYGWTWVSNYSWGWAPFHYGRWFYDDNYGWLWTPGHEWAPAWVTWGSYGDYYCWAPIAPRVDADVAFRGGWNPPVNSWNVVPGRRMTEGNVGRYVERTNVTVINNVTIINNVNNYNSNPGRGYNNGNTGNGHRVYYNRGPQINDVENVTHNRIQAVRVTDNARPGTQTVSGNQLSVYRPAIRQPNGSQNNNRPAPKKVESFRPGSNPNRVNQNQPAGQNPGNKPNFPQRNPQDNKPDVNQNPTQNQNPRPNIPQRNPQDTKPDVNQNAGQNQNPRPNIPPRNPQGNRPDVNQNAGQNPKPNTQYNRPAANSRAPQIRKPTNRQQVKPDTGRRRRPGSN